MYPAQQQYISHANSTPWKRKSLSQPLMLFMRTAMYTHTHHELTSCFSFWSPHICMDVCVPTMNLPLMPISESVSLQISNLHLEAARTLLVEDSVKKWPLSWGAFRLGNSFKFGHWQGYQLLIVSNNIKQKLVYHNQINGRICLGRYQSTVPESMLKCYKRNGKWSVLQACTRIRPIYT